MRITSQGSVLRLEEQRKALAQYVNRYTKDHIPEWAKHAPLAKVQFASDHDWLEHTYFMVTKAGRLDQRSKYCESYPTWPEGSGDYTSCSNDL